MSRAEERRGEEEERRTGEEKTYILVKGIN